MAKTVELGDLSLAYRESGPTAGPAAVFVHGLGEDSSSWQPQLEPPMPWHRYAYDLRGHGGTTLGAADGTLAQLAADLCAFLDEVSGPAACVGFSLGGTVVLSAAAQRPDLVTRAVVLGTSTVVGRAALAFYQDRIARALWTDGADAHGADAPGAGAMAAAMREDTVTALHRTDHDVETITALRLAAVGDGRGYANAARAMVAVNSAPLTPLLAEIACAVTVVGAEHDAFCPRKAADIILDALPSADYREVPAAGHLMNLDNPSAVGEAVFAALDETA